MFTRTNEVLKQIVEERLDNKNPAVEQIDRYFAENHKVNNFNGSSPKNVFIEIDNSFEDVCFILESHGVTRPKEIPIYEFQRKLTLIKKRSKPRPNGNDKAIHQ